MATDESNRTISKRMLRARPVSKCSVCGDIARHIHFGGLCCPSCKAFFRRVIQLNMIEDFSCSLSGNCEITTKTRRDCPYCRFQKCSVIGMEATWVMSEEDRKIMMYRRKRTNNKPLLPVIESNDEKREINNMEQQAIIKTEQNVDDCNIEEKNYNYSTDEENNPEIQVIKEETKEKEVISLLDEEETTPSCLNEIKMLSQILSNSFKTVSPIPLNNENNSFGQIFMHLCRVFTLFLSQVSDRNGIKELEKSSLSKKAVTKCILLYGIYQFDPETSRCPRRPSKQCNFPAINLMNLISVIKPKEILNDIKNLLSSYSKILEDVNVVMSLIIISFLNTENINEVSPLIVYLRDKYCTFLDNYMIWRYKNKPFQAMQTFWCVLFDVDKISLKLMDIKLEIGLSETLRKLPEVTNSLDYNNQQDCNINSAEVNQSKFILEHDYCVQLSETRNKFSELEDRREQSSRKFVSPTKIKFHPIVGLSRRPIIVRDDNTSCNLDNECNRASRSLKATVNQFLVQNPQNECMINDHHWRSLNDFETRNHRTQFRESQDLNPCHHCFRQRRHFRHYGRESEFYPQFERRVCPDYFRHMPYG